MKASIILTAAAAILALSGYIKIYQSEDLTAVPLGVSLAFQKWILSHAKGYSSPKESEFRLRVF